MASLVRCEMINGSTVDGPGAVASFKLPTGLALDETPHLVNISTRMMTLDTAHVVQQLAAKYVFDARDAPRPLPIC